ncbi:putative polygalacturonase At3g15720 [Tasmannia lanceolata]|uniref:putative polygalacturonase At3g15720 n=1 Tax=Tasmannia lanceolata TaxID=3420 RepID=UPI00406281DC
MESILIASLLLLMISTAPFSTQSLHLHLYAPDQIFDVLNYHAVGDGWTDDTQAFRDAWESTCNSSSVTPTMRIPSGFTFLLKYLTFKGPCKSNNLLVEINGIIVGPRNLSEWECRGDCEGLIVFNNVEGLSIFGSGMIDGQGSIWWECRKQQRNACERAPATLVIRDSTNVQLEGLSFVNSPRMHVKIEESTMIYASNLTITAPDESPNTDGIHIQDSQNVSIRDSHIGTGDDCISIGTGSSYINISTIACGPGHGISIGSLGRGGEDAKVEHIHVENVVFIRTSNGARIKTWQGGKGYARNIVFEKIYSISVDRPIIIDQYYCNGEKHCLNQTSAVNVSNVTYQNIFGTSSKEVAVKFACSETVACSNISMDDILISSSNGVGETSSYCLNAKGTKGEVFPMVPCLENE